MAKVVKTVVLVAAAVALVAFAAPIAGFVAGTLSITAAATIASIATVVTSIGLTLGATALMGLFRKTPSIPNATVERLNSTVVPAAPRKIVFGETAAGNDIRFAETSGSKKDRYDCVIALASHRINSVKAVHFENNLAWSGSIQSKFSKGLVGVRHVLEGKASNAIAIGSGSYWNSTSTFTGCAYMALRYKLDGELWPEGIPQRITTIVEGCPLYDPRRDSSNGGTGPHRIADQNTWAFHADGVAIGRNPALALLAYLIGYRIAGKLVWGMGVPVSRINFDSFRSYANLCEERVSLQAGGTVQRYTCDGILSTADSHESCINAITAAMGSCKLVDAGGQYSIIGGYDDTLGLKAHFTADDLVAPAGSTQPYVWVPAPPVRETYNSARGKFADPASLYQLVEWGTIETETLADGIERQMTVDLSMVSRPETCQRIASQFLLREAKTPGVFSAVFGPRAFASQVGSLVTLSLPAQGWNRKLFRVLDQAESHDLVFQMTLREESLEVYAWDREEKPLPANIRPEGYDPSDVLPVEGLAATTTTSVGASSYETSDISVTWAAQDSGRVAGIQIEARPVGVTVWSEIAALHNAAAGELAFQSVRPGAQIEIRARYRMATAVFGPWATVTINSAPAKVDWTDAISGEGKPENDATKGGEIGKNIYAPGTATVLAPDQIITAQGTSANTAKVGTRSATQVVNDIESASGAIAAEVLRGSTYRGETDQLIYMTDGTPVRRYAENLGVKTNDHEAYIAFLREVSGDGTAKFLLSATADGKIVGIEGVAGNGTANQLSFVASRFLFVDDSGNNPANALLYENGTWKLKNIEVDRIKAKSVTIENIAPGLSAAPRFTAPDTAIMTGETVVIETPSFMVGSFGEVGSALALISFAQDGSATVDTAATIRVYVDTGSGYIMQKNRVSGLRTKDGDTRWIMQVSIPISISSASSARIKVTAEPYSLADRRPTTTDGSYARDIAIDLLRVGR